MTFTKETALALLDASSTVDFPVDFDAAWQWLGYFDKATGKKALINAGFSVGVDFSMSTEATTTGISRRPKEIINLSVECLKLWSMMSGTEQGKQVRMYFLECEKIAKAVAKPMTAIDMLVLQAQAMQKIERQQLEMNLTLKLHEQRLEATEYHTKGYDDFMSLKAYCNTHDIDMSEFNPSSTAKLIVKYSKEKGYEVKKVADAKYGEINAYAVQALDEYFKVC